MSNEKFLPIKIFEKRKDYDDRSTEGGGDSREPSWVLHGDRLSAHVACLQNDIHDVKASLSKHIEKKQTLPMLMSTAMHLLNRIEEELPGYWKLTGMTM